MNLSHHLINSLKLALIKLGYPDEPISLEQPPDPTLGDRSCSVALGLAKILKKSPRQIAQEIVQVLDRDPRFIDKVEIAGAGYINFYWAESALQGVLAAVLTQGSDYGASAVGAGERRLIEFVSANPTGPLNIVSARAAAVGASLVQLLNKVGFEAHSEYYVNDSGRQVELLGASLQARIQQAQGQDVAIPEGGYQGDYIQELAKLALREYSQNPMGESPQVLGKWTAHQIVEQQRQSLLRYGVQYDRWFFESELYEQNRPIELLKLLQQKGQIYENAGAQYFRSSQWGDEEDRVVVTAEGRPTYFLPDMAYHLDKAERGYARAIDLWGPDHHGHVQRMQAALRALGLPENFLEVIIVQQVNLLRGGQPVKMSKRTGEMTTMDELIEEVGPDAAKQIFLSRRWSSPLDFDIEAAKDRSEKSPVFYVQYAHARIASILRKAEFSQDINTETLKWSLAPEERSLLCALATFPDVVETAALQLAPHRVSVYLAELATSFHRFYHACRVLSDDTELTRVRIALCRAVQILLKEGLRLLGMSAPEKM